MRLVANQSSKKIDTIFGATYLVLAPEHPLINKITTKNQKDEVEKYVYLASTKSELERQENEKNKTGVFTGAFAINPISNEKVPIWTCLLYTSPSPRDKRQSRMPSSA